MIGLLLAAALGAADAAPAAPDVPQGVVLKAASEESERRARENLQAMLAGEDPVLLARAMNTLPRAGRMPFLLGTFATLAVKQQPGFDPARVRTGTGKVPISSDVPMDFPIVGASGVEHRAYLAQHLRATLPPGPPKTVRAANFDELALVWFFIGWDLDAPLLVAEWETQRVLFDFDVHGESIEWVERLDRPCFTLQIEKKQVLDCYCLGIERREQQWTAVYVPAEQQPSQEGCGP
jgi:hypothetical protein